MAALRINLSFCFTRSRYLIIILSCCAGKSPFQYQRCNPGWRTLQEVVDQTLCAASGCSSAPRSKEGQASVRYAPMNLNATTGTHASISLKVPPIYQPWLVDFNIVRTNLWLQSNQASGEGVTLIYFIRSKLSSARTTTVSAVIPNFSKQVSPGAEAP